MVTECIDVAGRSSCKVADGSWKPCAASGAAAPLPEAVPEPSPSEGPVTVDGEACILPTVSDETLRSCGRRTATDWRPRPPPRQVYRGEVVSECIDIAGRSSCKTAAGSWKECAAVWSVATPEETAPSPDFSFQGAVTEDGEACILPTTVSRLRELRGERLGLTGRFQYRGRVVTECVDLVGSRGLSCKVADGSWRPCRGSNADVVEAPPAPVATSSATTTILGEPCVFPGKSL